MTATSAASRRHPCAAALASTATPVEWPDRYGEIRSAKEPSALRAPVERLALEHQAGIGLAAERLFPGRRLLLEREDLESAVREAGRDLRVEAVARALTHDTDRVLLAAQHAL